MENDICVLCNNKSENPLHDSILLIEDCAGISRNIENNKLFVCQKCIKSVKQSLLWVYKCREILKTLLPMSKITCKVEKEETLKIEEFIKEEVEVIFKIDNSIDSVEPEENFVQEKSENQCNICNLVTQSKASLLVHQRTHTGEKPHKCEFCQKCFSQKGTLLEHQKRFHNTSNDHKSCTCDFCGKCFFRSSDLKVHLRIHTKEKPYSCPYCPKNFSQIGTLINHKMSHTGEKKFSCEVCGKRFIASTSLRRHMNVHSEEKAFKCHICSKAVKTKSALQIHIENIHCGKSKQCICDLCGKSCSSVPSLRAHKTARHSELSGKCEECNKEFSNLEEHKRIHTGERPLKCDICSKRFSHKRSLTNHLNRHKNTDKIACTFEDCDKRFSSQSRLDYHVLKHHSKIPPYSCSKCSRGFYRANDLTRHIISKKKCQ